MTAAERLDLDTAPRAAPRGPLVSPAWLYERLDDPGVRVLDVRGRAPPAGGRGARDVALEGDYAEGHVPGAHFLDWTRFLRAPASLGALRAELARLGVARGHAVVLYDDTFNVFASRGAWLLRAAGYERARVLDGGWNRWRSEALPTAREAPPARPPEACPAGGDVALAGVCDLARALSGGLVVDARLPASYEGRVPGGARGGHVPGAVNVPYNRVVSGEGGRFATPSEIRRTLARAGAEVSRLPDDVVIYCDSGAMAAAVWAAFESVGVRHARVCEATFRAWAADPRRPVVTGPRP